MQQTQEGVGIRRGIETDKFKKMDTERSPLSSGDVPSYTFLGKTNRPPKFKIKNLQCCICGTFIALLILALVIVATYYLNSNYNATDSSNNSMAMEIFLNLTWPLQDEIYSETLTDLKEQNKAFEAGVQSLSKREEFEELLPPVSVDSPTFRHQLATYTSEEAQEMSKVGYILNTGAKEIIKCLANATTYGKEFEMPRKWVFSSSSYWLPEKFCFENITLECNLSSYRSANGTCNNLYKGRTWGAALRPFRRILLPKYGDGISEPRRASDGSALPSAREVSLAIHRPIYKNDVNFTVILAVWGQFIDHDITATALSKGKNGAPISCCHNRRYALQNQHPECFPVYIGKSDPFYKKFNVTCMEFVRSAPAPVCAFGPREQLNQVTSFLDGSVVYGSNEKFMNELRTFQKGELKMFITPFGELLPVSNDSNDGCNREEELRRGRYCFLSGDLRANENLLLTSMHLLFARQHNTIARELAEINLAWSDEKIFQESKKIIGAQIQHVTYNEFLPTVLPNKLLAYLNMTTENSGYSNYYNSSLNPTIANSFASAAFRFGHTLLPGLIQFLRYNASHREYLELHKMLFNPFKLFEDKFLQNFLKGALNTSTEKSDVYFNKEVTQKLFQRDPLGPCGLDLVSLNIQRGRDHGLPSYPNWRAVCGQNRPNSFNDLRGIIDEDTLAKLQKLHTSVDDVDLYTGGLAEVPVEGGLVGPTITCLLADQFLRLKNGDRFWYETDEEPQKFTLGQLSEIRKTTLAKIICKTTGVDQAQPFVMRKIGSDNKLKPCHLYSYPSFEPWREV